VRILPRGDDALKAGPGCYCPSSIVDMRDILGSTCWALVVLRNAPNKYERLQQQAWLAALASVFTLLAVKWSSRQCHVQSFSSPSSAVALFLLQTAYSRMMLWALRERTWCMAYLRVPCCVKTMAGQVMPYSADGLQATTLHLMPSAARAHTALGAGV